MNAAKRKTSDGKRSEAGICFSRAFNEQAFGKQSEAKK